MAKLGKYELLRPLASGGMAELFLARQSGLEGFEKTVVVKRLHPQMAKDGDVVKMFVDEARIAARLTHTNIVQIYDLGTAQGQYYIAMEWVRGHNLKEVIERVISVGEEIPFGLVAYLVSRVCRGLHYAHNLKDEHGRPLAIVHRDVSPQNVLLSFEGEVKLADFGIAKAASRAAETQAGILKGKVAYMSPEQVQREEVDARSDIFSAGILLYELSCRRRLFRRNSDFATMRAVIMDPIPPPSAVAEDIPDEIEMACMQALARDPASRFQSAQEMQHALEQAIRANGWSVGSSEASAFMAEMFGEEVAPEQKPEPKPEPRPAPAHPFSPLPAVAADPVPMELEDTVAAQASTPSPGAAPAIKTNPNAFVEVPTVLTGDNAEKRRPRFGDDVPTAPATPARAGPGARFPVEPATVLEQAPSAVSYDDEDVPTQAEPVMLVPEGPTVTGAAPPPEAGLGSAIDDEFEQEAATVIRRPDFDDLEEPTALDTRAPDLQEISTDETVLPEHVVVAPPPAAPPPSAAPPPPDMPVVPVVAPSPTEAPSPGLAPQSLEAASLEGAPTNRVPSIDEAINEELEELLEPPEVLASPQVARDMEPPAPAPPPPPQAAAVVSSPPPAAAQPSQGQAMAKTMGVVAAAPRRRLPLVILLVSLMVLIAALTTLGVFLYKRGSLGPRRTAKVDVVSTPAGATVYLDGTKRFAVTPTTMHGVALDRPHSLVVALEGHEPWRTKFTLSRERLHRRFAIKLKRSRPGGAPATLKVRTNQPQAQVFLDGELKGKSPVTLEVSSGTSHTLVIKMSGFDDGVLQLDALDPGELRSVHVTLSPSKAKLIQGVQRPKGPAPSGEVEIPRAIVPALREKNIGRRLPGE